VWPPVQIAPAGTSVCDPERDWKDGKAVADAARTAARDGLT